MSTNTTHFILLETGRERDSELVSVTIQFGLKTFYASIGSRDIPS